MIIVNLFTHYFSVHRSCRIICGDEDKTLREGMRFRRLMYGLIPPKFKTPEDEQDYIGKFKRLAEYLIKVREVDSSAAGVIMSTSKDPAPNLFETKTVTGAESMYRSSVQLRKGKQDPFEWIELANDVEFSTSKSFRIVYNWLAASASKVDTQVQLLHRRCTQFGLNLIFFPQTSISRDLLLNPVRTERRSFRITVGFVCLILSFFRPVLLVLSSECPRHFLYVMLKRPSSCTRQYWT